MDVALWIIGILLLLDGIIIAWLRRRGTLAHLPPIIPLVSMGMGAISLIAAFLATR